jgi:hypothetical protein
MSMKKFDLAKSLALKVAGQMKTVGVPDRFAQGAAEALDKREQRRRDAAAGLVPFACKLPSELNRRLQELAPSHEGGLNALVSELLERALGAPADAAAPAAEKPAARNAPAKKATGKAEPAAKADKADKAEKAEKAEKKAEKAEKAEKAPAAPKAAAKKAVSRKP